MEKEQPNEISLPTLEQVERERNKLKYQKEYRRTILHIIGILIVAAAVSVLLATMFFPIIQVSGVSMEPTLEDEQIILLEKTGKFKTGDLIGFYYQNKILLKRGKAYNTFTLTWNIGSIPEGQSVEKKYKVKLLDKLIEGGYTNKVEVDGRTKEVTIYGKDSFGYRYSAKDSTGTEKNMLAEPPKVGMKIKPESTIAKIVVDEHGNRLEADTNKKFKVSVYEGNSDNAGNLIKEIELYQGQAILLSNIKKDDNTPVYIDDR